MPISGSDCWDDSLKRPDECSATEIRYEFPSVHMPLGAEPPTAHPNHIRLGWSATPNASDPHVRFRSLANILGCEVNVRFTPQKRTFVTVMLSTEPAHATVTSLVGRRSG